MCFDEVTYLYKYCRVIQNWFVYSEVKEKLQESFANISDSFLVLQEVNFLFWFSVDCMDNRR